MALGDAVVVCSTTFEGVEKNSGRNTWKFGRCQIFIQDCIKHTALTFSSMVILYLPV